MAEEMRNRLVYTVFDPTDKDALDILMNRFDEVYPDTSAEERENIRDHTKTMLEGATPDVYLALAPSGRVEQVSAVDLSIGWEPAGHDLFLEIQKERERQVMNGYSADHDDEQGGAQLIGHAQRYLEMPEGADTGVVRERLVKALSVLVATVEMIERAERRAANEAEIAKLEEMLQKEADGEA